MQDIKFQHHFKFVLFFYLDVNVTMDEAKLNGNYLISEETFN